MNAINNQSDDCNHSAVKGATASTKNAENYANSPSNNKGTLSDKQKKGAR